MSWLSFTFRCANGHTYDDIVQGADGAPDPCPTCGDACATKQVCMPPLHSATIPMYPGNKRQMAGYGAQERRPAEKAGRQVSVPRAKSRAAG